MSNHHNAADRGLLRHFLAAIAYRTQKAVRAAPPAFPDYSPGRQVRTPVDLLRHMTSVLGYARTYFVGGSYPTHPDRLPSWADEIDRFHAMLGEVDRLLAEGVPLREITERQLLQGPLSDVMTHVGQLAVLRRLSGSPIPPENFIFAEVDPSRLGPDQAAPARPDAEWPERPE